MPLHFEKKEVEGNEFILEFAKELSAEADQVQAARIIMAFFRTLRNHLTLEENFELLIQLPLALKGMYVNQWNISQDSSRLQTLNEFIIEMVKADDAHAYSDFQSVDRAKGIISKLLRVFNKYVSDIELRAMIADLPTSP